MDFTPMLAAHKLPKFLKFPFDASPKLDGWRAVVGEDGTILARSGLPIPSPDVQRIFKGLPPGLDGELIMGDPTDKECYIKTESALSSGKRLSAEDAAKLTFFVFDHISPARFEARQAAVQRIAKACKNKQVVALAHERVNDQKDVERVKKLYKKRGYEGVILRRPDAPYKHGRSTESEQYMLKIKEWVHAEALVTNVIPDEGDARMMGTLQGTDLQTGVSVNMNPGEMPYDKRVEWMQNAALIVECQLIVTYRHLPYGARERRRSAILVGIRNPVDMS